jgi:predicted nuclease of predicted toxin-antitoxin system
MLRLASDADVHGEIIRGLRRRMPKIDLVRAQDALREGALDPEVLAWAAAENRILITNDRNTMVDLAYQRVTAGEPVPGLIVTTNVQSIGGAIDDILLVAECMSEVEIRDQIVGVPALPGMTTETLLSRHAKASETWELTRYPPSAENEGSNPPPRSWRFA